MGLRDVARIIAQRIAHQTQRLALAGPVEDDSFETEVPNSLGQLGVRRIDNRYFEIYATVVSYRHGDYDDAKEFTQAFLDNHPTAVDWLMTLWDEAELFAQNYILGRKSRP